MTTPHQVPIAVALVDIDVEAPTLDELAAGHRRLWIFLRTGGCPRSVVEIDLDRPDEAERHYAAALEDAQRGRRGAPPPVTIPDDLLPEISVVISTTVARVEDLDLCLSSVRASAYPRYEVILADNRPVVPTDDPLPALLARHPGVRRVHAPRPGLSSARAAGISAAEGEIIAFTDDDVRVDPLWLRALGTRMVLRPDEILLTGLILPAELETPAQLWMEHYYGGFGGERAFEPRSFRLARPDAPPRRRATVVSTDATGREVRRLSVYEAGMRAGGSCNMAVRREPWARRFRFDLLLGTGTPSLGGEDLEAIITTLWAGETVGYEPAAVVHHRHRRTAAELRHQIEGCGVGFAAAMIALVRSDARHGAPLVPLLPRHIGPLADHIRQRQRAHRRTVREETP